MIVTRIARSSPGFLPNRLGNEIRAPSRWGETRADLLIHLVGDTGIEPVTSSVSTNGPQAADQLLCIDLQDLRSAASRCYRR